MTKEEQLMYLIKYLLEEEIEYKDIQIPKDIASQKYILRSLFNVRMPSKVSEKFLKIQDTYLQSEIKEKGIVDSDNFKPTKYNDRMYLYQGDITTLKIDAIVNAANSQMLGCFQPNHNCIDNIIHTLSGVELRLECDEIMKKQNNLEKTGQAKITSAYNLPCKYIIHTVGPIITDEIREIDRKLLRSCYKSCLEIASKNNIKSIAFCCISTGVFKFDQREAAKIAIDTVSEFLKDDDMIEKVVFDVFLDKDREIYEELLGI